jgi:GNAT superfamily N-acetyltransferase
MSRPPPTCPDPAAARIRRAGPADEAALVDFNRAMARETEGRELDPARVTAGVRAVLRDPGHGFYLVAEADGAVLGGLLVTYEWSDWRNARFWWVQSVYIRPPARRRGLYRRLYGAVRERARASGGVCGFRLYVERENRIAQGVYEGLGMRRSDYLLYEEDLPS